MHSKQHPQQGHPGRQTRPLVLDRLSTLKSWRSSLADSLAVGEWGVPEPISAEPRLVLLVPECLCFQFDLILQFALGSMMSTRAHHSPTTPGAGQKPPTPEDPIASLVALEEKARRLLKRCRYEESAKTFKEVVDTLQLQRQAGPISISPCSSLNWGCSQEVMVSREVGALEGLAICHSRMLK